jgi:hypothetical protein
MWRAFDQKGLLNVGRTTSQVAAGLGKPDRVGDGGDARHVRWTYGFMQVNFVDDQLHSVVDPRGLDATQSRPLDAMKLEWDGPPWSLAYRTLNRVQQVAEFVPPGQTAQDWQELFTVQRLLGLASKQVTPRQLLQDIHDSLRQQHPDLAWQVIQDDDQDLIYEWRTRGDKQRSAQHEIARLVAGREDLHRLAYSKKVAQLPSVERERWIELIRRATLAESPLAAGASN